MGALPSAFLLAGPPMTGKTTVGERLAKALLCRQASACGTCESCRLPLTAHPDVLRVVPDNDQALSGAVSALLRRLRERPVLGSRLVVFLERIDRFSPAAVALLLKGIEDAPAYVQFFLTADTLARVPATIRSRCVCRTLAPLSAAALASALERDGLDHDSAQRRAELAGGRPGLALRFAEDPSLLSRYRQWYDTLERLPTRSLLERSRFAESLDTREEAEAFLHLLQGLLRDRVAAAVSSKRLRLFELRVLLRRSREALSLLLANVPSRLAVEHVLFL